MVTISAKARIIDYWILICLARRQTTMENTTKLADLRLVNKYYPPVSNYSYPRSEIGVRQERPVGRSSVGSDCSVPGMTDDQESDISTEDANQYRLTGDELWDTFWEAPKPLCGTKMEEESRAPDVSRSARYPALIPSAVAQRKVDRPLPWEDHHVAHQARNQPAVNQNTTAISCWPLVAAEQPVNAPGSKTIKASYSLFPPQPKPTPVLNVAPRRPSRPPRSGCLWETPSNYPATASHSSLGRPAKPRKLHLPASDGAISYNTGASFTQSAPVSPTVVGPSLLAATTISRRSEPNDLQAQPRQMTLPRICSDTTILYSMTTDTASQETLTAPTIPPRSPQRRHGHHSRQQSQLRNSITVADLASTPTQNKIHIGSSTPRPSSDEARCPITPPPPPPRRRPPPPPRQQQQEGLPTPVSVFELDSDDDDDDDDDINFARRIVRNLTPHKRTRSATVVPKSRKGNDLAREQLRRARAGTLSPSSGAPVPRPVPEQSFASTRNSAEERDKDAAFLGVRKQRTEVFGRLFGGRW